MTSSDRPTYFLFLGDVFRDAREALGLTQDEVARRGGPSKPKQTELESGSWTSSRPNDVLKKIDIGFRFPEGTARRVLFEEFDPIKAGLLKASDGRTVGGLTQDADKGYVNAPGPRVDGGVSDSAVLDAINEMRQDMRDVRREFGELRAYVSERLDRRDEQGS